MQPRTARRALVAVLVLAALALLLGGCANTDAIEGWYDTGSGPKPYKWLVADSAIIQTLCPGKTKNWTTHACAVYGPNLCVIVAETPEASTPKWLAEHEKRHCLGWRHP